MFYIGEKFDLKTNKEYKTIKGAKEAAEKAGLNVFDEVGQLVESCAGVNTYDADKEKVGTTTQEEVAAAMDQITENEVKKAVKEQQEGGQETAKEEGAENLRPDRVETVHGKIKRVFEGKLRIRRAPLDDLSVTCGVSLFDTKRVTEKHTVSGKVWYKTLDGYFISGDPRHTEFIQDEE